MRLPTVVLVLGRPTEQARCSMSKDPLPAENNTTTTILRQLLFAEACCRYPSPVCAVSGPMGKLGRGIRDNDHRDRVRTELSFFSMQPQTIKHLGKSPGTSPQYIGKQLFDGFDAFLLPYS